ncbi:MAG: MFS transporter [Melioribacteraceae bacterium]|nr:MFS transporter [Melioribacteraceae bacterium]
MITSKDAVKISLYKETNLRIIFLVTLMAVLGVSSITPAFPKIASELNLSADSISLLIIFFTLPGVILTPIAGVLADRIGRKKIMVPSLFLFGLSGTACFFTKHFETLVILRFFQGVGAASIGSLNITLIGDIFSGKERAAAMGYNASVLSTATAAYPVIGGALATIAWNVPFILPVFAIPVALAVLYKLSNPEPSSSQSLINYFKNTYIALKSKNAVVYFTTSLVTFILLYGCYLTYFPFLLDNNFAAPPFVIGLLMSTMSVVTAITSFNLGRITSRIKEKQLLKLSFILYALSLAIIPLISNLWLLIIPLMLFGIAQGTNIPSLQLLLTEIAPLEYRGAFMSFNGMILRLGQTLGPVIISAIFLYGGLSLAFYAGAIIAVLNLVLLVISISQKR